MRALRLVGRQMEEPRMQVEVLPHRQFGIERERLRHVADALRALMSPASTGLPNSSASPSLGGSRPVSIFIVVVLPQPLEPRNPKISPRSMVKLDIVDRGKVAEPAGQVARDDHRLAVDERAAAE